LALLVQHPELAAEVSEALPQDDTPGISLFNKIIELSTHHPQLTTGVLLELFRDQPEGKWLASLVQQELTVPPKGLKAEFLGALSQLRKQAQEQVIQKMLEKNALGTLTAEEKQTLSLLIINKKMQNELS
jgi:DNA primase